MNKLSTLIASVAVVATLGSCATKTPVYFNEETKAKPVIVARLEAKEGKTDELITLIEGVVKETRKEDGNLCYNVYQDIDVPTKFIIYEVWASDAALAKHSESAHLNAFKANKDTIVTGATTLATYERSIAPMPKSSPNSLVLFASINAKDGKAAELQAILESLIVPTLAEVGAEHYELHKLKGDENGFLYHETWTTVPTWDAHMLTPHLVEFLGVKDNYVGGDIGISRTKQIF